MIGERLHGPLTQLNEKPSTQGLETTIGNYMGQPDPAELGQVCFSLLLANLGHLYVFSTHKHVFSMLYQL